jgi:hypothetical protein
VLFPLLFIFFSCAEDTAKNTDAVYLGGEIVNPTSHYLTLYRNGRMIDTIFLDNKNKFSYRLKNPIRGLYNLKHKPETQPIYIEPGDSLLMRVNTFAFDESIHFSGKGDARNNFMTEMFLEDEKNADLLLSFYKIDPYKFASKLDSVKQGRLRSLELTEKKHKLSNNFVSLAQKIIEYENYDLKERFIYLMHRYSDEFSVGIPEGFTGHREKVDFNDAELQSNAAYRRFIENYLINNSFEACQQEKNPTRDCLDLTSFNNVSSRINKVGELIELPVLRNYFLAKLGVLGIVMAREEGDITAIMELLEGHGLPKKELENLEQLGRLQISYLPGRTVSELPLLKPSGDTITFNKVVKRPTILFLWSIYSRDHQDYHKLINQMRQKYPEIDFIGLNMDIGEVSKWQLALQRYGYDPELEYQVGRTRIRKEFFNYYLNKLLFLDSQGKVIIGDAFINSPQFESRILEFLNQ